MCSCVCRSGRDAAGHRVPPATLTSKAAPGVHAHGPQERLVGVADAVVEGEAGTQQRSTQAERQEQDDQQVQSSLGRTVQLL